MQKGFFDDDSFFDEVVSKKKGKKRKDCFTCGLYKMCKSPKMQPTGNGRKKILIVAEAPGRQEDEEGRQLVGDSGKCLRNSLKKFGYDLDKDFWKTNAVICRPPNNRKPTNEQIECCKIHLINTIEKYKPTGIILFGESAFTSLLGEKVKRHLSKHQFNNFIGCCIPDQSFKMWVGVMYHPSFVLRSEENGNDTSVRLLWERNLKNILKIMKTPFYVSNYRSDVFTTQSKEHAISWINSAIEKVDKIALDYETTGLKPHRKGHEVKCMSFSDGVFAYAFPNFKDEEFQDAWKTLLKKNCDKVAHNLRFESMWTQTALGFNMIGNQYDTMLAAHCWNNKMKTGLKFWAYILFGVLGYNEDVEKYIKQKRKGEDEKSTNSFSLIENADIDELLLYNGLDSLLCFKLSDHFESNLEQFQKEGLDFLIEGSKYLLDVQQKGIKINTELLQKTKKEIDDRLTQLDESIMQSKEVKDKWKAVKKFSYTSTKDLSKLLFDVLQIPKPKKKEELTASGAPSLDKKNLPKYEKKYPFIASILDWKKWDKSLGYIEQFEREIVDGVVHPFFNLNIARSFRPSTSDPNFANIPKRDKEVMKMIRQLIIPSSGNRLLEYDYATLEVVISACYNKDPALIEYILDDKSDMHLDMASLLFMKDKKEIDRKTERFYAKNDFVFAEFYGDYYVKIAPNLWKHMPVTTKEHLKECGIRNYRDFEDHVRQVEQALWEKFRVYAEWKKKIYKEYLKKGYVDSYTGFRYHGWMKRNEVTNYPIQGSAFHVLLWVLIEVSKELKKRKIKRSYINNQIYDCTLWDCHPDDEQEVDGIYFDYATKKVREYWDWIICPLKVEKERSSINGNWAEMEDCGILKGDIIKW